ncbi:hypothetical protein M5J07_20935 [Achromobacter mucicolens]|uniref:hypothetical protein n=1 Tax=Achromobacter mucicolens TaxID=1389922 RepID=UPI0020A2F8D0|nr:hypothetical protein [Achromobacter mucicolens]MCP2517418.1 hypothetical protein [Achromobacter mucicolens]
MSTATRNAEITRRRLAGERPKDLANEFGVTTERIWQIVQAEQRRQRGEPSKPRRRNTAKGQAGVQAAIRPRLRLWRDRPAGEEWWECVGDMRIGVAATKPDAYGMWLGKGPSTASTSVTPKPAPKAAPLTPVHVSQVQVLPSAAIRKPLSFAARLGLNLERVGQAQPPMHSLAGARSPRNGGFHDQE